MARSDVRLDDERVTVDAATLDVRGTDIVLDSAARRAGTAGGTRRALVHDDADGLTINFDADYSGGVTVNDARVNLRCLDGGQSALPRTGRAGDLIATISVRRLEGIVIGQSVTLWFCIGHPLQVHAAGPAAHWVPISHGAAVEGTG